MRACNTRRRRGNVVVAVAGSLVTLLACVSLSVDGGMLQDRRRNVQSAADAAALAAASDLYYNWKFEGGDDRNLTAWTLARETARTNGYEHGVNGNTVDVYIRRARVKYAQVGRTAPTKADMLARAIEDGLVTPDDITGYESAAVGGNGDGTQ